MTIGPEEIQADWAADWHRLGELLPRYYPHWRIGSPTRDGSSLGFARPIPVSQSSGSNWALAFQIDAPRAHLGGRDAAFGMEDREYPAGLWPLQLSLALCLRVRMVGWWADLSWPGGLLIDGASIGAVVCRMTEQGISASFEVRLGESRGTKIPEQALAGAAALGDRDSLVLTLVQAAIAVIESPWPRQRMLRYYQDWCVTLGTKVAGVLETGEQVCGIASGVNEDGSLTIEALGGRLHRLPVYVRGGT